MPITVLWSTAGGRFVIVTYSGRAGRGLSRVEKYLKELSIDDRALFYQVLKRLALGGPDAVGSVVKHERDGIWRIGIRKHHFPFILDGNRIVVTHGFASKGGRWTASEWTKVDNCVAEYYAERRGRGA